MRLSLLIIISFVNICTDMISQPSFDPRRIITVQGEAEAYVPPDRAIVVIGVETEGVDVLAIKQENDKRVTALYSTLKGLGIEAKDIQTSDLSLTPQYDYSMGKRTLLKYMMRNVVTVLVKDLSKVGKVIDGGLANGVNILNNVNFTISNSKQIEDSLRVEAVKEAVKKAQALAPAAGAKVGPVMSIEEQDEGRYPRLMPRASLFGIQGVESQGTEVSAGELVIHVRINAKFGLE